MYMLKYIVLDEYGGHAEITEASKLNYNTCNSLDVSLPKGVENEESE